MTEISHCVELDGPPTEEEFSTQWKLKLAMVDNLASWSCMVWFGAVGQVFGPDKGCVRGR